MKDKKITICIGKSGSGKSHLVKKLIADKPRLLVYDTMSEYEQGVIFEDCIKFLEFWKHVYRGNFRMVYRPEYNPQDEIDEIAEDVYFLGRLCFVLEEVTAYCSPNFISDQLAHIVQRGRHKDIELIATTQRPYGLHRLLTSMASDIYIFNTNEPRDRQYLSALLGSEVEEKLNSLQKYEYIHWKDGVEGLEIGKAAA